MALTTEEAAVNTAVDALIAAWVTMMNAKTQGDLIQVIPIRLRQSGIGAGERWGNSSAVQWDFGTIYKFLKDVTTTGRFPTTAVGEHPMFFKVTNASRNLT